MYLAKQWSAGGDTHRSTVWIYTLIFFKPWVWAGSSFCLRFCSCKHFFFHRAVSRENNRGHLSKIQTDCNYMILWGCANVSQSGKYEFCRKTNTHTAVAAKNGKNSIKFPGWGDANFNQCYRFFFFLFFFLFKDLVYRVCITRVGLEMREGGRADIIAQERRVQLRQCCITYNLASNRCTKWHRHNKTVCSHDYSDEFRGKPSLCWEITDA